MLGHSRCFVCLGTPTISYARVVLPSYMAVECSYMYVKHSGRVVLPSYMAVECSYMYVKHSGRGSLINYFSSVKYEQGVSKPSNLPTTCNLCSNIHLQGTIWLYPLLQSRPQTLLVSFSLGPRPSWPQTLLVSFSLGPRPSWCPLVSAPDPPEK